MKPLSRSMSINSRVYQLESSLDGEYDSSESKERKTSGVIEYTSPKMVETFCERLTNGMERENITNKSEVRPEPMRVEVDKREWLWKPFLRVP